MCTNKPTFIQAQQTDGGKGGGLNAVNLHFLLDRMEVDMP